MSRDDILIFRTSIKTKQDIERIETLFAQYPCIHKWNVDLEDWEKVLRIECSDINSTKITSLLKEIDIEAQDLE